jgi:hypothetical protein
MVIDTSFADKKILFHFGNIDDFKKKIENSLLSIFAKFKKTVSYLSIRG